MSETRIAVVMNGGISLAVWMGGVTHELRVVGTGSACHATYKTALANNEAAAQRTESKALSLLKRSPALLENTKLVLALIR